MLETYKDLHAYRVKHPLSHTFAFWVQGRPAYTPVQSCFRADFIAKFWANKFNTPVTVYHGIWGYYEVLPDKKVQS